MGMVLMDVGKRVIVASSVSIFSKFSDFPASRLWPIAVVRPSVPASDS